MDICALINSTRSLVYRQLEWVGVQRANNYKPSHIFHEVGLTMRSTILPTAAVE